MKMMNSDRQESKTHGWPLFKTRVPLSGKQATSGWNQWRWRSFSKSTNLIIFNLEFLEFIPSRWLCSVFNHWYWCWCWYGILVLLVNISYLIPCCAEEFGMDLSCFKKFSVSPTFVDVRFPLGLVQILLGAWNIYLIKNFVNPHLRCNNKSI